VIVHLEGYKKWRFSTKISLRFVNGTRYCYSSIFSMYYCRAVLNLCKNKMMMMMMIVTVEDE